MNILTRRAQLLGRDLQNGRKKEEIDRDNRVRLFSKFLGHNPLLVELDELN